MKRETILAQYRAWLTHREYSPATIQNTPTPWPAFLPTPGRGRPPPAKPSPPGATP